MPGLSQAVRAGATLVYLLLGDASRSVVLINAGSDPAGTAILQGLAAAGRTAADVQAILLTDGLRQHRAALRHFDNATVYVGVEDYALAQDRQAPGALVPRLHHRLTPRPPPAALQAVLPGSWLRFADTTIEAVNLSGYTAGSMGYVARGVAYVGDSVRRSDPSGVQVWPWPWSANPLDNRRALARLRRLQPRRLASATGEVEFPKAL